jgi:primosomal protein N'
MKEHLKKVLWDHQNDAINLASTYISKNDPAKSCLMKLPTGSGKTAIFAVLSRVFHPGKNFLILVPSIALKR